MFYTTIDKVIGCYEYKQQRFLKERFLIRSIDIAISIWHKTIVYIYEWLLPTFWSDICHSFNTHTYTYWASYLLVDINVHQKWHLWRSMCWILHYSLFFSWRLLIIFITVIFSCLPVNEYAFYYMEIYVY